LILIYMFKGIRLFDDHAGRSESGHDR